MHCDHLPDISSDVHVVGQGLRSENREGEYFCCGVFQLNGSLSKLLTCTQGITYQERRERLPEQNHERQIQSFLLTHLL